MFAVYAAVVIWLIRGPLRTATRAAAIVVVGGLLTAVWTLPLVTTLKYTTDMRYEPVNLTVLASGATTSYFDWLFISEHWFLFPLVIVAIIGGIVYRRRATLDVVAIGVAAGLRVLLLGRLAATSSARRRRGTSGSCPSGTSCCTSVRPWAPAEIVRLASRFCAWVAYGTEDLTHDPDGWSIRPRRRPSSDVVDAPAMTDDALDCGAHRHHRRCEHGRDRSRGRRRRTAGAATGAPDRAGGVRSCGPRARRAIRPRRARSRSRSLLVICTSVVLVRVNATRGYLPYWAKYNYTGYEGGKAEDFTLKSFPEYHAFMETVDQLPPGRMLWEGSDQIGVYGTPLALMLVPYWTDGRITTMRVSTTRLRRRPRTTSWPPPCSCRSRRTRCGACRTARSSARAIPRRRSRKACSTSRRWASATSPPPPSS